MPLTSVHVLQLAAVCAPGAAPETLLAIARVESGLDPLAIGLDGRRPAGSRPASAAEAAAQVRALAAAGHAPDLGLAQISLRNLAALRLTPEAAFDPCRNLAAAARVLGDGYARGLRRAGPGQPALRVALSHYNTGHPDRGLRNGYAARVAAAAPRPVRRRTRAPFLVTPAGDRP